MLGERLATLRKQKKLTQEQVAAKIHISRATYAQYEINRRVPEYLTLEKLADYFEVTIDYLVGREIKEPSLDNEETDEQDEEILNLVSKIKNPAVKKGFIEMLKGMTTEK